MADIGQFNKLRVTRAVPYGVYLDGGDDGEILLTSRHVPAGCKEGDELDVFVYFDSEDELAATTQRPRARVGQFAYLKVVSVTKAGAFLDWGLPKDLFVPIREQQQRMREEQSYIVYVNLDNDRHIVATSKIDKFLDKWPVRYEQGQEVSLLIADKTDLGYKAIIDNRHWGLIHDEDIFKPLRYGKKENGYIKKIREDEKIDLSLRKLGIDKVSDLGEKIIAALKNADGFLPLHDKSSPDEIRAAFGESKKSFKDAIGILYKQRKIVIEKDGIRLQG